MSSFLEKLILLIEEIFGGEKYIEDSPVVVPPPEPVLTFDTQHNAYHATRVLCDAAGLTLEEKNLICACIFQESRFKNTAKGVNRGPNGEVLSTDWGLCQINDYYHIGKNKDFPSVDYVLQNPDKVVQWMISMYKHGLLKQWVSYSSKAYLKWLSPGSPMWSL
jgi:hypothetical protein